LVIAVLFAAIGIANREPGWAVGSVLPAMLGVASLVARPERFTAELAENELRIHSTGRVISYSEMREVRFISTGIAGEDGTLHIAHEGGRTVIPDNVGAPTVDVLYFLWSKLPPQPMNLDPAVAEYYHSQVGTFGEDRIWAHPVRTPVPVQGRAGRFA